jgi:ribonuclease BN (tRNA processing enzyme)
LFNKCQERFGCSEDFFGLSVSCNEGSIVIDHVALTSAGIEVVERQLHMPPSVIGQIAQQAHVKRLVLSHRMLRTLSKEAQSLSEIRKNFSGPVAFANDLDCFPVP